MHAVAVLLITLLALPAFAAGPSTRDSGDAAHLFAYRAKPGHERAFDEGYRQHLAWHRQHGDPLVWYGWTVMDGPDAGLFVDGSFGAPFAAFDQRVDPAGDGADAAKHFSPHADPQFRASYRLRRELSSDVPLEQWRPTPRMQVTRYVIRAGARDRFEHAVQAARAALPAGAAHTWYEAVTGTDHIYLLLIARQGWADYDGPADHLDALLARSSHPQAAQQRAALADAVLAVSTESWEYRPDLSLIPAQ